MAAAIYPGIITPRFHRGGEDFQDRRWRLGFISSTKVDAFVNGIDTAWTRWNQSGSDLLRGPKGESLPSKVGVLLT